MEAYMRARRGVVFLHVVPQAPHQVGDSEGEEKVGEQGADQRGPDHLDQPGAQRDHGDDELGQIAERAR